MAFVSLGKAVWLYDWYIFDKSAKIISFDIHTKMKLLTDTEWIKILEMMIIWNTLFAFILCKLYHKMKHLILIISTVTLKCFHRYCL